MRLLVFLKSNPNKWSLMRPANHLDANREGARPSFTRRDALAATASIAGAVGLSRAAMSSSDADVVARIENEVGGRIGLAALDTASGLRLSHRADERFAMLDVQAHARRGDSLPGR